VDSLAGEVDVAPAEREQLAPADSGMPNSPVQREDQPSSTRRRFSSRFSTASVASDKRDRFLVPLQRFGRENGSNGALDPAQAAVIPRARRLS
jgi:hypothetical protein